MSPLQLSILLHYYIRPIADFRDGDFSAPAVSDAISEFLCSNLRLLEPTYNKESPEYQLTERGHFYIEHLLSVPLPECRWYIPITSQQQAPE